MGRARPGPDFHVNFGSGWVGSLHLWVGFSRSRKSDPHPTVLWPKCERNVHHINILPFSLQLN